MLNNLKITTQEPKLEVKLFLSNIPTLELLLAFKNSKFSIMKMNSKKTEPKGNINIIIIVIINNCIYTKKTLCLIRSNNSKEKDVRR